MNLRRPSHNPMIPDAREIDDNIEAWPSIIPDQNFPGMIKELTKDESIPKEIKARYWGFLAPEVVLANFNPDDEREWDNLLHLAIQKMKAAKPYFEHTPQMDVEYTNIVAASRRKMMRARGADRERVLMASSIQENRVSDARQHQKPQTGVRGFFRRLMGG